MVRWRAFRYALRRIAMARCASSKMRVKECCGKFIRTAPFCCTAPITPPAASMSRVSMRCRVPRACSGQACVHRPVLPALLLLRHSHVYRAVRPQPGPGADRDKGGRGGGIVTAHGPSPRYPCARAPPPPSNTRSGQRRCSLRTCDRRRLCGRTWGRGCVLPCDSFMSPVSAWPCRGPPRPARVFPGPDGAV